jgi:hypothetical protein
MESTKHLISLDQAKKMTKKFREDKRQIVKDEFHGKHIIPTCETFERDAFDQILKQSGCVGVRAYYAMDDDKKLHLIFVGVNSKNEDILPPVSTGIAQDAAQLEGIGVVVENGTRCPADCPPTSPLNS